MEPVFALLHLVMTIIIFSKCNGTDCTLLGESVCPQISKDGDVIIGGIFSFHSSWEITDFLDVRAIQFSQSLMFAIEEINNNSSLLPGVSLGYKIYDACTSKAVGVQVAMALVNGNENSVSNKPCTKPAQVQAIIGESFSSVSMAVVMNIGPFSIPLVINLPPLSVLVTKKNIPHILRTVPSDYHQSRALAEMVRHFGWTWVGAIRRDDDYGNSGMAAFTQVAQQWDICLEYSLPFFKTYSQEKVMRIIEQIKSSTSQVIVGFVDPSDLEILLDVFYEHNITGYQWVGTEAWILNPLLAMLDKHNTLQGAIGLAVPKAEVTGLKDFILDLNQVKSAGSAIFTKYWETLFHCKYKVKNDSEHSPLCTGEEELSEMDNTFTDMSLMPYFNNVYKGVYAIAHTLHDLLGCKETCSTKKQPDPLTFLKQLKMVHFKTKDGEDVYFDKNGDPAATYEVINWQTSKERQHEFVTVGLYDSTFPVNSRLTLNLSSIVPISVCSESCPTGTRKAVQKGKPLCCFDCIPCAEGEISNKTVVSIVGALMTLAISLIFFKYKNTPIVKVQNSELSFLLLFSLTLCFLCSLTFIGRPSEWSCMLRHTAFGITFVLCISCVLRKTIVVLMAFRATLPGSNVMKWFGPPQQRLSVLAFALIQVLICMLWLIISPPFLFKNQELFKEKIILECNFGSSIGFWAVLGYIGLLALLCFVLAFLARKLPDNFNEAKCITFSMLVFCAVWITFIPVYVSSPGKFTVAVEIFGILASSFGLLFCIFLPKCYIIILKPEKNTKNLLHYMQIGSYFVTLKRS
uniref:G-protein coupled receptors family 3 profile domain-containing protein n=1 Tax=Electrophorus electricus TaxID=8005 RepID=A0AAY5F581_ELEEL